MFGPRLSLAVTRTVAPLAELDPTSKPERPYIARVYADLA